MIRQRDSDLRQLTATAHDLLIVGGGVHGAWAAWDAALRGLSVALIDRGAFGGATSANSLRIVHGGLRYLARGDLVRMRESIQERATLLRVAPRFVVPLPMLVPTYRHRATSRPALGAALRLNDLLSWRRNRGAPPEQAIPNGRLVSIDECRRHFPAVDPNGLTGGALWYDGYLRDPEGLVTAIVGAAARQGAVTVPNVRAERLIARDGVVHGVSATDRITAAPLEIRARATLLAAGPWGRALWRSHRAMVDRHSPEGHTFAINVQLRRQLSDNGIGVYGGGRYFFLVPDGDSTLAGTWYLLPDGSDERTLIARGTAALLDTLRAACPAAGWSAEDVIGTQSGWLPLADDAAPGRADALADRPRILASARNGADRLILLEGVKFTTARRVAARAIDRAGTLLGTPRVPSRTAEIAL